MTAEDLEATLGHDGETVRVRTDTLSDQDEAAIDAAIKQAKEMHWTDQPPGRLDQLALRWFGSTATKRIVNHPQLGIKLAQARIVMVPIAYLAGAYLKSFLVLASGLVLLGLYVLLTGTADPNLLVPLSTAPVLFAVMTYSYVMFQPDLKIRTRRKNVEENLPYALNFMAAMSGAGVVPVEVFGALGAQPVYGEVAREAANVYRDTKVFSKDVVTAMKDAARRSPSKDFEEFLMGSVNTVSSGGDLRTYFLARSQFLMQENRRKQKSFLEGLGVMAESYVVVGAAAPLFIIVIVSIMVLVNSGVDSPEAILNLVVLLGMPVIHAAFAYIIGTMKPT